MLGEIDSGRTSEKEKINASLVSEGKHRKVI
jgi:hypothetical protein